MTLDARPLLLAAALALGTTAAFAQAKLSTLGGGQASGKLLTREELRQCLKVKAELAPRRTQVEAELAALEREKRELQQADAGLQAERDGIARINEQASSLNRRGKEHAQQVSEWNERYAKFQSADASGPNAERQRIQLQRQRNELDAAGQTLDAERKAFASRSEQAVKDYEARVTALGKTAAAWNARNAEATKTAQRYEADFQGWSADCADRPYREDDEIAIRDGK